MSQLELSQKQREQLSGYQQEELLPIDSVPAKRATTTPREVILIIKGKDGKKRHLRWSQGAGRSLLGEISDAAIALLDEEFGA